MEIKKNYSEEDLNRLIKMKTVVTAYFMWCSGNENKTVLGNVLKGSSFEQFCEMELEKIPFIVSDVQMKGDKISDSRRIIFIRSPADLAKLPNTLPLQVFSCSKIKGIDVVLYHKDNILIEAEVFRDSENNISLKTAPILNMPQQKVESIKKRMLKWYLFSYLNPIYKYDNGIHKHTITIEHYERVIPTRKVIYRASVRRIPVKGGILENVTSLFPKIQSAIYSTAKECDYETRKYLSSLLPSDQPPYYKENS